MKYIGEFTNWDGEDIEVLIITQNDASTTETITLAGDPVEISSKENDSVFEPVKGYECVIRLLSRSYYFDMYSPTTTGVKVEVNNKTNRKTLFKGFVTPNIYDQDFVSLDEIEINCISSLSALEYMKYPKDNLEIKTFYEIISMVLNKVNINQFYFPATLHLTKTRDDLINKISVSELNFIDDDDEQSPWTLKEAMEELCRYLGITMTMINGEVWFIDYDYISKHSNVSYYVYNTNNGNYTLQNISSEFILTKDKFRNADMRLGLDQTFGEINVSANSYPVEELIPDGVFDDENLTLNPNTNPYITYNYKHYKDDYKSFLWWDWNHEITWDEKQIYVKLFESSFWKTRWYNLDGSYYGTRPPADLLHASSNSDYYKNFRMNGASIMKEAHWDSLDVEPSSLSWNDLIFMSNSINVKKLPDSYRNIQGAQFVQHGSITHVSPFKDRATAESRIQQWLNEGYRYVGYEGDNESTYVLECETDPGVLYNSGANDDLYLVISGKIALSPEYWLPMLDIASETGESVEKEQNYNLGGFNVLWAQVSIGDKYWNGKTWTTDSNSGFHIQAGEKIKEANSDKITEKFYYNKWMNIRNNVSFKMNITSGDGYAIPLRYSDHLSGKIRIRISSGAASSMNARKIKFVYYTGNGEETDSIETYWYSSDGPKYTHIKDFKVKFYSTDKKWWNTEEVEDDIIYKNIIDQDYYGEENEIELKINTQVPGKLPSKSSVITSSGYLASIFDESVNEGKLQENRLVEKYSSHYKTPKIKLGFSTKDDIEMNNRVKWDYFDDKWFGVDYISFDVKKNLKSVGLVEI